jgi:hypothetical protein
MLCMQPVAKGALIALSLLSDPSETMRLSVAGRFYFRSVTITEKSVMLNRRLSLRFRSQFGQISDRIEFVQEIIE